MQASSITVVLSQVNFHWITWKLYFEGKNVPFHLAASHVWLLCSSGCCSAVCLCSHVNVSWMSLHLKYSDNTWCRIAKGSFFTSHHQWKQLWVLKNITAWMCGWVETRDIVVSLRWGMLCGTPHCHIILWTRKEMTGQHQQGNLLCKRTSCTMPGTLMASVPSGPKIAKRMRRQNSFSSVQGIDFKYTVNTLTDSKGREQRSARLQNDPHS